MRVRNKTKDIHTYRVPKTIQMKLTLLCVWAERVVLGSAKTILKSNMKFNILLHTQLIVCATVKGQCLEYLGCITFNKTKNIKHFCKY